MKCPHCPDTNAVCKDTRQHGDLRRRRYRCEYCGVRFTTIEMVVGVGEEAKYTSTDDYVELAFKRSYQPEWLKVLKGELLQVLDKHIRE